MVLEEHVCGFQRLSWLRDLHKPRFVSGQFSTAEVTRLNTKMNYSFNYKDNELHFQLQRRYILWFFKDALHRLRTENNRKTFTQVTDNWQLNMEKTNSQKQLAVVCTSNKVTPQSHSYFKLMHKDNWNFGAGLGFSLRPTARHNNGQWRFKLASDIVTRAGRI